MYLSQACMKGVKQIFRWAYLQSSAGFSDWKLHLNKQHYSRPYQNAVVCFEHHTIAVEMAKRVSAWFIFNEDKLKKTTLKNFLEKGRGGAWKAMTKKGTCKDSITEHSRFPTILHCFTNKVTRLPTKNNFKNYIKT